MIKNKGAKIAGIILLFFVLCVPVSLAASNQVLYDTASFSTISNSNDISWSHTVGTGTDRMLVVGISIKAGSTADMNIKSVKFGDTDMIYVNDSSVIAGTEGDFNKTLLYYLPNPNSGTSAITVSTIGNCKEISAKATSLSNVYQGVPEAVATNTMNDANGKEITAYINTVTDNAYVVSSVTNSLSTVNFNTTQMTKAGRNSVIGSSAFEGYMAISCAAFTPVNLNPKVSIAYNFNSTQQSFAVGKLEETLLALHYLPVKTNSSQASGQENIIVRLASDSSIQPEGFKIAKKANSYIIEAADEVGAMYGVLEISEKIRNNGLSNVGDEQVNPKLAFRALQVNVPWSSYRYDASLDQHYQTMRDVTYWESLLDMMVEQRFNKLTLFNMHPYPYMIRPTNFPKATPFTDEELAKWKFLYQNIFRMAKERGIETYLMPWNIFVSEAFKQNYDPKGRTDMMSYKGDAYFTPEIEQYTKENVTQVLNEYPDLTGIALHLAENMGGMTPEEREQWLLKTYVEGIKAASRPAKLIHKMPASGNKQPDGIVDNNMLTETMTHNAIESITGLAVPIDTSVVFNGSHPFSSTKLLGTHGGTISDGYWNPLPKNYRINWLFSNEDVYILRWAQPDYIRENIANNYHSYVGGYFVGSENYYPALNYMDIQNPSDNWTNYGFQRQWMFYMTWGRLMYDPSTPDTTFVAAFNQRYGNNVGDKLLKAYKLASNFPTLFGAFTNTSWDFTSYAEGFLMPVNTEINDKDKKSPFYSLEEMMKHSVFDPNYLSIQDYAGYVNNGKSIPAEKITPLQLADTLDKNAQEALKDIKGLSSKNPAFQQEIGDIQAWCYLSRYFADKLRSGVELAKYDATHDPQNKAQALAYITAAKSHWDNLVLVTESRYKAIGMPQISKGAKAYNFAWKNCVPETETNFSWKNFVPEVERDINFVKEY